MTVNCFENTVHTLAVLREMQKKVYYKVVVIAIVFIFSAAVGDKGMVRSLIEAILPLALVQDAIRFSMYISRLNAISDNFRSFFTSIKDSPFENRQPEAMRYVIEYETTLAWAAMPTESKIFFRLQKQLELDWDELKKDLNIKNQ